MISEIIKILFSYGVPGILILLVIYWLLYPDKAEIASGQFYRILKYFWKGAEKKYIAHDTQGRINDFVNNFLIKEIKDFIPMNIAIDWITGDYSKESFFKDGKLIVRIKKSENQNQNIVNAAMIFIAQNVLSKAKKYISVKQKESIDLFIAKKLFEKEREEVMKQFVDDYLIEKTDDGKIGEFFEKYHYIDRAGLFFPVFIQEMNFLGEKVFAQRRSQEIYTEVNGLINFLDNYSLRKVGDTSVETRFNGLYCKFGLMIVGLRGRIESEGFTPYKAHIERLQNLKVETIYLIGDIKNKDFIDDLCSQLCGKTLNFSIYNTKLYDAEIKFPDEHKENRKNYLVVLRRDNITHYFPTNK